MWAPIGILPPDLHANRPAASAVPKGQGWVSSDVEDGTLYVSDGTTWHEISASVNHIHEDSGSVIYGGEASTINLDTIPSGDAATTNADTYHAGAS